MTRRLDGLYAVTPDGLDTERLLALAAAVLAGGAAALQYRSKSTDVAQRHEQASELLALCRAHGVPLIVNDDLRLADLTDADGVHLGRDDASLVEARLILGPEKIVGASCYASLDIARAAARQGADYLAFGGFFASPTKPAAMRAPLELLRAARAEFDLPLVAIGGISRANAAPLLEAGADALAVISDVFDAADPRSAAAQFARLFA